MMGYHSSEDQRPLTYWNGYPVYATTLIIAIHVVAFLVTALIITMGAGGMLNYLAFSSVDVLRGGQIWQFLTYGFIHLPETGIWFAIEMLMLFWFGREVEQYLGRKAFLWLYAGLMLLVPVALTIVGFAIPTAYAGSRAVHFAIFVGFAALYPSAMMMFGLAAKWVAIILVALSAVQAIAYHNLPDLVTLVATLGAVMLYIGHHRGQITLPTMDFLKPKPKFSVVRDESPRPRSRRAPVEESEVDAIDPLLDKIARSGLASLTPKERERLEKAREALLKKGPSPR
jgi:membrane associated rhomboid family serine protease